MNPSLGQTGGMQRLQIYLSRQLFCSLFLPSQVRDLGFLATRYIFSFREYLRICLQIKKPFLHSPLPIPKAFSEVTKIYKDEVKDESVH